MRQKYLIFLISILCSILSHAQEYVVSGFDLEKTDLTARTQPRVDANGRKCAVIKLYADDNIAAVRGASVGDVGGAGMEKWIYMAHDSKIVEIVFDHHLPLKIVFEDFGYPTITGQMTYICKLKTISTQQENAVSTNHTQIIEPRGGSTNTTSPFNPEPIPVVPSKNNNVISSNFTQLPLNPTVRHGKLSNGLSYYILHNEYPNNKANFYLAQKVGSSLEAPEQLGFSHFLEHMAFSGTKNFPGNSLLDYLSKKGVKFGNDINAYTSIDETIYMINNVSTLDTDLIDHVLLALRDWSCDMTLDGAAIESEKAVIEQEWRVQNNPSMKMLNKVIPEVFTEFQYQHLPMGKMEIVRNLKPQMLRDYYEKWYRPDLQGIVVVGDIDVDKVEKQIISTFGSIPTPINPAERIYVSVSDNREPIFSSFTDKDLPIMHTMVIFKADEIPSEMRNSVEGYLSSKVFPSLITELINERLKNFTNTKDCHFTGASVQFGHFLTASNKDAFQIDITPKSDTKKALSQAMEIVSRACGEGFTDTEWESIRNAVLLSAESDYNNRNNIDNNTLGNKLNRHFIENTSFLEPETEYKLVQQILSQINKDLINSICKQLLTSENQVVIVTEQTNNGISKSDQADILGIIRDKLKSVN